MPSADESGSIGVEQGKQNALRVAGLTARQAREEQTRWAQRRDDAIAIAHRQGASLREIAAVTELSHVGVKKILDRRER